MRVQVNGMGDWSPEKPLVAGWYTVQVAKVEEKVSESGVPMVLLSYQILDGPEQPDGADFSDRMVFDNLILDASGYENPRARKFIENKMIATVKSFGADDGDEFDTDDFIGKEAEVNLSISKGLDGNPRNEVKGIRPVGGFPEVS